MNVIKKKKKLFNISIMPIIIMLIGPPGFREYDLKFDASQGSMDIWVIFKTFSYLFIFLFCAIVVLKNKNYMSLNEKTGVAIFSIFFIVSNIISSIYSSNTFYSLQLTFLFFIGFFYFLVFQNLLQKENNFSKIYFIKLCRQIYTALLLITFFFVFINPKIAGLILNEDFGVRIQGSKICDFRFTSLAVFVISFYLYFHDNFKKKDLFYLLFSILCLYFSKTRGAIMPAIILAAIIFISFLRKDDSKNKSNFLPFYLFFIFSSMIIIFFQDQVVNILTRNQTTSLTSLSGRDIIWSWSFDYMANHFWGAGFANGFKSIFTNLPIMINPETGAVLFTKSIGNAHNVFIEVLVSSGWIAFFSFIFLIILSFLKNFKNNKSKIDLFEKREEHLILMLFCALILFSFFDATMLVPTSNSFGFFWTIIILIYTNNKKSKNK